MQIVLDRLKQRDLPFLAVILVGSAYALANALLILDTSIWRHDAVVYLDDYTIKLEQEGRWISYFAYPLLKSIGPSIAWAVNYITFTAFFYIIFYRYLNDAIVAIALSLTCITLSPFNAQFMWPITLITGPFILLAYAYFATERNVNFLNIIFGILLFGVISSFIFLLPLVWIAFARANRLLSVSKWIATWVLGFAAGYCVSNLVTLWVTGDFISIAEWRRINPPESLQDIVRNAGTAVSVFAQHFSITFSSIIGLLFPVFLLVAIAVLTVRRENANLKSTSLALILAILTALAVYAQSIAAGIFVSFRTSAIMAIACVMIIAIMLRFAPPILRAGIVALLILPILVINGNNSLLLKHYFNETGVVVREARDRIEAVTGVSFSAHRTIYIFSTGTQPWDLHDYITARPPAGTEWLTGTSRWGSGFLERRGQRVMACEGAKEARWPGCETFEHFILEADCGKPYLGFCQFAVSDGDSLILFTRTD